MQEAHRKKRFEIRKVAGVKNPADILTKPLSATEMTEKLALVGARFVDVRGPWCVERGNWALPFG